ncbi:hypothetical protein PVL29_010391 [Vitis rotundifolia]|uniref:F-box domain-containing protein n=1 Tax=Vitis rotundifolia TaxID=103349 RepID=A0AA38ZTG8_VITRO|nr:hypothetical protein PVL29_010391 [Vitis rotundifolia]
MKDEGIVKEFEDALSQLPEHIIYCILMKLPARDLHNKFRFICKSWYRTISSNKFISQNAINSKPELLIQVTCSRNTKLKRLVEVEEEENGFKLCEFDMKPVGRIRPGCHGLHFVNAMRALNPLTKFILALPRCPSYCPHEDYGSALGYDPTANQYKVVHVYNATFGFEKFDLGCSDVNGNGFVDHSKCMIGPILLIFLRVIQCR